MAQKPETIFKQKVFAFLGALPKTYFFKVQQTSRVGDPDVVCSIGGRAVFLELKAHAKARIDTLQIYNLKKAESTGALALVVFPENWPIVRDLLTMVANRCQQPLEIPECLKLPSLC